MKKAALRKAYRPHCPPHFLRTTEKAVNGSTYKSTAVYGYIKEEHDKHIKITRSGISGTERAEQLLRWCYDIIITSTIILYHNIPEMSRGDKNVMY